ncbi:hypothetical protein ACFE04_031709 [Oxalis oulophora]
MPRNCENTAHATSPHHFGLFLKARRFLQEPFENILRNMYESDSPTIAVISDMFLGRTLESCNLFHIPRITFNGMGVLPSFILKYAYFYPSTLSGFSNTTPFQLPSVTAAFGFTKSDLPNFTVTDAENAVAVNTNIQDERELLNHIIKSTNMKSALEGECGFLAANMYAKSIFGEDALVNISIEKQADIISYHRVTTTKVKVQQPSLELAIVPTIAVRKIFNSVHQLTKALSLQPCQSDLVSYLKIMKKLEEALKFLTSSKCRLAVQWLGGIIEFLEENAVANNKYLLNVQKLSELLVEIQVTDQRARLNGGILFTALNKLEIQFESILTENSSIFDRLHANGRVSKCLSVYIEARVSFVRKVFLDMDLAFLDKPMTEFDDTQDFEEDIDKWCSIFLDMDLAFLDKPMTEFDDTQEFEEDKEYRDR